MSKGKVSGGKKKTRGAIRTTFGLAGLCWEHLLVVKLLVCEIPGENNRTSQWSVLLGHLKQGKGGRPLIKGPSRRVSVASGVSACYPLSKVDNKP